MKRTYLIRILGVTGLIFSTSFAVAAAPSGRPSGYESSTTTTTMGEPGTSGSPRPNMGGSDQQAGMTGQTPSGNMNSDQQAGNQPQDTTTSNTTIHAGSAPSQ